jgi:hypothetical protein
MNPEVGTDLQTRRTGVWRWPGSDAMKELPFPWPCGKCGERAVERETLPYSTVVQYDGRAYTVEVPEFRVPRCRNCGAMVFDDSANDQVTEALRRQVGLFPPDRIRSNRQSLGLTRRDFAGPLTSSIRLRRTTPPPASSDCWTGSGPRSASWAMRQSSRT